MTTILNVIWFVLAGLWLAIGYFVTGLIFCIFIVTIPFGIANMRLAGYVLWPFGRTIAREGTTGCLALAANLLWLILFGWELALAHLVTGLIQAITIIGIPLAVANWKMIPLALWPFGARVVDA